MESSAGVAASPKNRKRPGLLPLREAIALLLLASMAWSAGQDDLYGPDAPRDTAYLRFINAHSEEPLEPVVDGSERAPADLGEVTPYGQVQPGRHEVSVGNRTIEFEAQPESFTTIALLGDGHIVFDDTPLRDISRGLLTLYNLTSEGPLSLQTADGSEVFSNVPAGESRSQVIAQAEAEFVVERSGETLMALDALLLERGTAHSLIVLPSGTQPRVVYAQATAQH